MPLKRDATAGEYWRSEYLGLAKLLIQAASSERGLAMPLKRDATAGEYWRCEYLGLATLLS